MDTTSEELRPLVSVNIASYNRGSFLRGAVESVLAQTYKNWELIIVDDGSTDTTASLLASYGSDRIHIIRHTENKGIHASRTAALAASSGDYVAVLDSDDLWHDCTKLEKQVAFLETHPEHVLVGTFIRVVDEGGSLMRKLRYYTDDAAIRQHILIRNQFAHSSVLLRRSAVEDIHGYQNVQLAEDLDLYLRLGRLGKFANLPFYFTSYRVHKDGISSNGVLMAKSVLALIKRNEAYYANAFWAKLKLQLVIFAALLFDIRSLGK